MLLEPKIQYQFLIKKENEKESQRKRKKRRGKGEGEGSERDLLLKEGHLCDRFGCVDGEVEDNE